VSGLEEAVTRMLAIKAESKKPVEWISADNTYSAGVYLSTVADRVSVLRGGSMGSVGTITTLYDYSAMLAKAGLRVEVIASGEQQADGNPDVPLTEAAIARAGRKSPDE
jgi:ClpP class serine protease